MAVDQQDAECSSSAPIWRLIADWLRPELSAAG